MGATTLAAQVVSLRLISLSLSTRSLRRATATSSRSPIEARDGEVGATQAPKVVTATRPACLSVAEHRIASRWDAEDEFRLCQIASRQVRQAHA